jgi:hypothetical protein
MGNARGGSVRTETHYDGAGVPIVGDFNGDSKADIFWYD